MPFFRYQAVDPSGAPREGTIQAKNAADASRLLRGKGFRPTHLVGLGASGRVVEEQTATTLPIVKTRWGTARDIYFLFSQLASYVRSGVNPAQACANLAQRTTRQDFRRSLEEAAQSSGEGTRLSAVLRRYPYLYPPHVVGILSAGEAGGFLPEACDTIAGQADESRRFFRIFGCLGIVAASTVSILPGGVWAIRSALRVLAEQDKAGGTASPIGTVLSEFGKELLWPVGPITLAALLTLWLLRLWWSSMPMRLRRHGATLRAPILGKRAWSEGMALFAWALACMSRAGAGPRSSVLAAAEAIPNLAVRARIDEIGRSMADNTRLSDALGASPHIPEVFKPLIHTGEMTGDLASQLEIASKASREDQQDVERAAKARIGCWVVLLLAIGMVLLMYLVYGVFYGNLFDQLDEWSK